MGKSGEGVSSRLVSFSELTGVFAPPFTDKHCFSLTSFLHLFQEIQATELRKSKIYIQVYVVWMKFFLIEVIPYILIIVLNSIMIAR